MAYFHYRCGERITLLNDNCTAVRNSSEFDHGLVVSAEPLTNDVLFEIKIDKKINSWSGSLVIGVTEINPLYLEFPPSASKLQEGSWIMSGNVILKDGVATTELYGADLDKMNQDDRVGVMRTSEGDLVFYINGESQGVAAESLPPHVYAIVDLYGKCVQVSITQPLAREHNNDDCMSGSSVLAIDNDVLNVTLGADLSELSLSSSNSLDVRMDLNVSLSLPDENLPIPRVDRLRFHERAGTLVKLSAGNRTAERRRPLDEFNNGVVMTHRSLQDNELFEIRLDRLVDKWSGSIEMGITTHNPSSLEFPATMTNMRSGTIMMSGCGILTNGKGTRREYGEFNLDELGEGDRIGMMRRSNGCLHYFINGLDQGVAASRVPTTVWGVIDLYGMTIRVSIVERDEREEQNLMTRRNTREQQHPEPATAPDYYDRLTFHTVCGTHADVINNGRTAHRPNAADDFNNGVVLTARPLKLGELFEVRLDKVVTKWAGSIEIGVTTHSPVELEFPFTMTNVRSGTWMMTGNGVMHNGTTILDQYGLNLDRLQVGDRVGVERKENGTLHFYVNGIDQGPAASNVAERVFGVIDLYGQAAQATIIDMFDCNSPDTLNSSLSNTTLYSDLRFHHVHGKNARISNNGQTALRPRAFGEFNDAIVFSSRPLRDGELFEVTLDQMVDRWSGSIELGVTAVRPDDVELPSTATDLSRDTWMLSGSSVMENGVTIRNNYTCDLDALTAGTRVGVMRNADKGLEFYLNGLSQGVACVVPLASVYAVVDLYGQCAQVSLPCSSPVAPLASECIRSETSNSLQGVASVVDHLHRFSECHGKSISLSDQGLVATRGRDMQQALVFSAQPLKCNETFELVVISIVPHYAGTLRLGVTTFKPQETGSNIAPVNIQSIPGECWYITGNEVHTKTKLLQNFTPSLNWLREGDHLRLQRSTEGTLRIFVNSEELSLGVGFSTLPDDLHVFAELYGTCTSLGATSSRGPTVTSPVRLQDSLELVLEPLNHDDGKLESVVIGEEMGNNEGTLEFYENHGRNIELLADKRTARRVASYNQGVILVGKPLVLGKLLEVKIDQLDAKWNSSLMVGVIGANPERLNFPVSCLGFKRPCCIIANDWLSLNGIKVKSDYGAKLNNLPAGAKVGIMLTEHRDVQLWLDGCPLEPIACDLPPLQPCYAVFDLYGQCQQISLVHNDAPSAPPTQPPLAETADQTTMQKSTNEQPPTPVPQPMQNENEVTEEENQNEDDEEEAEESDAQQCEKADLESHEKETTQGSQESVSSTAGTGNCSSGLTLPLNNLNSVAPAALVMPQVVAAPPPPLQTIPAPLPPPAPIAVLTPLSPRRSINCKYLQDVKALFKSLVLPQEFFLTEPEPMCYCANCFVAVQQDVDLCKGETPVGWVKFPLRNLSNVQTEKWHSAFYGSKLSVVRAILDRGQPLTAEQMKWCNLCPQRQNKGDSGSTQIKFYPSLEKAISSDLSFITTTPQNQKKESSAAFQLLVKPGAYSTGCDSAEWSTKENGAVALHALLLRCKISIL